MKINTKIDWAGVKEKAFLEEMKPSGYYLPLVVFLIILLLLTNAYHLLSGQDIWGRFPAAVGNAFQFCESNRMADLIRQPANTWSNLIYLLVGLFIFSVGIHDYKNKERKERPNFLVKYPLFTIMYAFACFYLFVGSFLFHASLTRYHQILDQSAMLVLTNVLLGFILYNIFPTYFVKGIEKSTHAFMMLLIVVLNYFVFLSVNIININVVFPIILLVIIGIGVYKYKKVKSISYYIKYMLISLLFMLIATSIWILDRSHILCNPTSYMQGHAVWHVLNGVSILLAYLYFRTAKLEEGTEEDLLEANTI